MSINYLLIILAVIAVLAILSVLSVIAVIAVPFLRHGRVEGFNNLRSRIALYEHPNECPFEKLELTADPLRNNKLVVSSKLKDQPPELDNVFDSLDDYQTAWNQLQAIYPNLEKCDKPYQKYLRDVRQYYLEQKYAPNTNQTTTPLYKETFVGNTGSVDNGDNIVSGRSGGRNGSNSSDSGNNSGNNGGSVQIDVPTIYTNTNLPVRQLTRTVFNSSQLNTDRYMSPNTANLLTNEQIDTSVTPANDRIPITNNPHDLMTLKNQMVDANFEQQRTYQKQTLQMRAEIDHLRREIENLRTQLIQEKTSFEDLDRTIEQKSQQVISANSLNADMRKKLEELKRKNDDLENLYLLTDSHKVVLETRLQNLRTSVEEDYKTKGYTYLPPIYWTMNQYRPPNCLPEKTGVTCPVNSKNTVGDYQTVFNENATSPEN
jgi:hypothetical protein